MNIRELLRISSKELLNSAAEKVLDDDELFDQLLPLSLSNELPYSWRGAWLLSIIAEKKKSLIFPHLDGITRAIPNIEHDTQKASLLKTLIQFDLPLDDLGELVDICFDFIEDPKKKPALKVYSMEILFNIAQKEPEFKNELGIFIQQVQRLYDIPSIQVRTSRILKKLGMEEERE